MTIKQLNEEVFKLESLEESLGKLQLSRSVLDFKGHQKHLSISIGGCVGLSVSYNTPQTGYMERPIRGMEMIILGAQKLYNDKIETKQVEINECKLRIKKIALMIASD